MRCFFHSMSVHVHDHCGTLPHEYIGRLLCCFRTTPPLLQTAKLIQNSSYVCGSPKCSLSNPLLRLQCWETKIANVILHVWCLISIYQKHKTFLPFLSASAHLLRIPQKKSPRQPLHACSRNFKQLTTCLPRFCLYTVRENITCWRLKWCVGARYMNTAKPINRAVYVVGAGGGVKMLGLVICTTSWPSLCFMLLSLRSLSLTCERVGVGM